MHPLFANRAFVNPPCIINSNSALTISESDSASSFFEPAINDSTSNNGGRTEHDGDPFVTGASPNSTRGKRKRKSKDNATSEALKNMIDVFQKKWAEDKRAAIAIREEEKQEREREKEEQKEKRERVLDVMMKSQQSMSDAVEVLRSMARKM